MHQVTLGFSHRSTCLSSVAKIISNDVALKEDRLIKVRGGGGGRGLEEVGRKLRGRGRGRGRGRDEQRTGTATCKHVE